MIADVEAELAALVKELETVPEDYLAGDCDLIADLIERATAALGQQD